MGRTVGLVSCTKRKRESAAPPRDLYDPSPYFRKMRRFADANHDDWYVLSAKHGLLDPDGPPIEPYDETLNGAPVTARREWARDVFEQVAAREPLEASTTVVLHAGKAYYGTLLPLLQETPVDVEIPTEGLQFGETLA